MSEAKMRVDAMAGLAAPPFHPILTDAGGGPRLHLMVYLMSSRNSGRISVTAFCVRNSVTPDRLFDGFLSHRHSGRREIGVDITVRPFDVSGMESSGSARRHLCVIESNSWSNRLKVQAWARNNTEG